MHAPTAPSATSPQHFPYSYDTAIQWDESTVLLGINTSYIPASPKSYAGPVYAREDGLWGLQEWTREPQLLDVRAPFLVSLPIPLSEGSGGIYLNPPVKEYWIENPSKRSYYTLKEHLHWRIKDDLEDLKLDLELAGTHFELSRAEDEKYADVVVPSAARMQALNAYGHLMFGDIRSWADYVYAFATLQRSFLEVVAFLLWWNRVGGGPLGYWGMKFRDYTNRGRGFIVEDSRNELDKYYRFYSVELCMPVYCLLSTKKWKFLRDSRWFTRPSSPRCSLEMLGGKTARLLS